jgi:outer membrane translocation and assembly module TamA
MGSQHQGRPLGGTEWWVANAEIVQTISGPIKGVSFLDLGSLSGDIEIALGLGVRLDLPIGPVRLEYGHNMSRDEREPSGTFHFALGISF